MVRSCKQSRASKLFFPKNGSRRHGLLLMQQCNVRMFLAKTRRFEVLSWFLNCSSFLILTDLVGIHWWATEGFRSQGPYREKWCGICFGFEFQQILSHHRPWFFRMAHLGTTGKRLQRRTEKKYTNTSRFQTGEGVKMDRWVATYIPDLVDEPLQDLVGNLQAKSKLTEFRILPPLHALKPRFSCQEYFTMCTDQKAACKAFMKQLLEAGIVDASAWPRVQAKWFMEDLQCVRQLKRSTKNSI